MLCLISVLAINVVFSYSWQSLPSPGIRAHDHTVVYDPVNDKYFIIGGGDSTGGYKCFKRKVLEAIDFDKIHSNGYAFQIEMNFKAWKKGFQGKSKMSKRIVWEAIFMVWKLRIRSILGIL